MKLLLDQNLSYKLVSDLQAWYPETSQVRLIGMERASDEVIWDHARRHGFTIVTQDSDFHELSVLYGSPPKVVWLKCGNSSKGTVRRILIDNFQAINHSIKTPNWAAWKCTTTALSRFLDTRAGELFPLKLQKTVHFISIW